MKIIPAHSLSQGEKYHRSLQYRLKGKLKEVEKLFKRFEESQYSSIRFKNYKVTVDNRWVVITLIKDSAKKSYYREYQCRFLFDDIHKPGRIDLTSIASSLIEHDDFMFGRGYR